VKDENGGGLNYKMNVEHRTPNIEFWMKKKW